MGAADTQAWIEQYAEWTNPRPEIGTDTLVSWFNRAVATQPRSAATWFMGKELTLSLIHI